MKKFTRQILSLAVAAFANVCVAMAQEASIKLTDTEHDNTLPVEVTSDLLDTDEAAGTALFTGNARAVQGQMILVGHQILLEQNEAADALEQVTAMEDVVFTNGIEVAEGDHGVYHVETETVELTGNVLLIQGNNTISGDHLTMDLTTSLATMTGNVRTVYTPKQKDGE